MVPYCCYHHHYHVSILSRAIELSCWLAGFFKCCNGWQIADRQTDQKVGVEAQTAVQPR